MPNPQHRIPWATIGEASTRRSFAIWIWSTLLIVDAVLLTRRFSGEFQTPLPATLALLATTLVASLSYAASILYASANGPEPLTQRRLMLGLCVVPTLLWSIAISAHARPLVTGLLTGIVVMQALFLVIADLEMNAIVVGKPVADAKGQAKISDVNSTVDAIQASGPAPQCRAGGNPDDRIEPSNSSSIPVLNDRVDVDEIDEELEAETDDSQTHWMSRRHIETGEIIEGWVRVPFEEGQRETVVHVSFCPPLAGSPSVETHDLDGTGLEIRTAAIFPFGARLSVRRTGSLDARTSNRVGFVVQADAATRAA